MAKLTEEDSYTIVQDYLGTPIQALNNKREAVWDCVLDIYGDVLTLRGERSFVPFRFQGQYEDEETGLYYNRFRYNSPHTGNYISQDPIRLAGGMRFYAYVHDPSSWVDTMGLSPVNLNSNNAVGNFGVYEIKINGELHKIGKADLGVLQKHQDYQRGYINKSEY